MKYKFTNEIDNKRLFEFLSENINGLTASVLKKQLKLREVKLNGKRVDRDSSLVKGDEVEIFLPCGSLKELKVETVYLDENIAVVYKPSGMDTENNLTKAAEQILERKVYPVHRLDRNTEGLIVFALDLRSYELLKAAIKERLIKKYYKAKVYGEFARSDFTAKAYLKKDSTIAKAEVRGYPFEGALEILTRFKTMERKNGYSEVEVELITGRTHQIRAHAAFLGHPVLGDGKYSTNEINSGFGYSVQQLKAVKLVFGGLKDKLAYLNGLEVGV